MSRQKTHHTKQFKLDAINYRKSTLILQRLNVQRTWVSVSVLLLAGKPSSEIMTVIFPLSVPAVTLLMKRRKSPTLSVSCVMDLYARKIIAWTLADTMEVSTVIETINKAKACRNTDLPLIIHSDRGSQYISNAWRETTEKMQQSYSHSGYPYDNACIESFYSLIKREWLNRFHIINYKHAYRLVFEYIETFYNTVRIHSHCDYMSPNDFEKLFERVSSLPAA